MLEQEKKYWVGFNRIRGIGAVRTKKLLDSFGSLSSAWNAPRSALEQAGLGKKITSSFLKERESFDLDRECEKILNAGIEIILLDDERYPQRLKNIEQPPPVLFIKGNISPEDNFSVAIVGTRAKTAYGKQVAQDLANFLARNGVTVVSGLARGIDSIAHEASLDAGGRTLAVFGSGVDVIYPPEHRNLAERIIKSGALISDYYPGTHPESRNFPPRNRIISGLSIAVIIIEAGERSGALITAEFAAIQGREVFAVPGPVYAPRSKGTNRLIRDGALPLVDFDELLTVLDLDQIAEYRYARKVLPQSDIELLLFNAMKNEPMHINDIKANTGLSMEKVSSTLVMMELKGMINKVGNMMYISISDDNSEYEAR